MTMKNTKKIEWTIKVGGFYYTGVGTTVAEAKADAMRVALLKKWGMA